MTNLANKQTEITKITQDIRKKIGYFEKPQVVKSLWQLANSLVGYLLLFGLSCWAMRYSFWLALPLMALGSGFLLRLFIIFHDCGHGAFFRSKRLNTLLGIVTGLLTFTPYHYWHKSHARHHATSANLDKRGFGDVWMMTADEYSRASRSTRLKYRLYRNPFIMFGLGPLFLALVTHRWPRKGSNRTERLSVHLTNVALLALAVTVALAVGAGTFLLVQGLILYFALVLGIWIFYVQHQFEGVYWEREKEWDFITASVDGASFYRLPAILNWFTGNIGYHHVHHLSSRIPNYNLRRCHRQLPVFTAVPQISLWSGFKALGYRLWDERKRELISFRALKAEAKN